MSERAVSGAMSEVLAEEAAAEHPSPADLVAFLPYAARQLRVPFTPRVDVQLQAEYVARGDDTKRKRESRSQKTIAQTSHGHVSQERRSERSAAGAGAADVRVRAVLDAGARVVELQLAPRGRLPRQLLQLLRLCAPHQPALERLAAARTRLSGAALHELARLLPLAAVTDVSLDDSPVRDRNYHELLASGRLRRLSLARCSLDDDDCVELAARLALPAPASRSLASLALSSNMIGDRGAAALGEALRSNRALVHLDLAGNRLTDAGCAALLAPLARFPLRYDEIVAARGRRFEYLRRRAALYECCRAEAAAQERGARRRTVAARRVLVAADPAGAPPPAGELEARVEALVTEALGPYEDPFAAAELVTVAGLPHCVGDRALVSLNLSYNALGPASLRALRRTLQRQAAAGEAGASGGGLLRVPSLGNPLPEDCLEYELLEELLARALQRCSAAAGLKPQGKPKRGK